MYTHGMSVTAADPIPGHGRRKKLLLMGESAATHAWETLIVGESEYAPGMARDGAEGAEAALREHGDPILMDVVMPRVNGFEPLAPCGPTAAPPAPPS